MKKISKILLILIGLVLIGAGGGLQVLAQKSSQKVNGEIYVVMPKKDGNTSDDFHLEEIKLLQKKYGDVPISYESSSYETLQNMGKQADVQIVATTKDYIKTCNIQMKQGSFFLEDNMTSNEVVIDEKAAYALWGTDDCIGETLMFRETKWKIIGIAYNKEKGKQPGNIYFMGSVLKEFPAIHLLYIRFDESLQSQNKGTVKQMLEQSGHSEKNYEIVNLTQCRNQIAGYFTRYLKGILFIGLMGAFGSICRHIVKDYATLKMIRKRYYICNYIKEHSLKVAVKTVLYVGSMVVMISVMKTLSYDEIVARYSQQQLMGSAYKMPRMITQLLDYCKWGRAIYLTGLIIALIKGGIIIYFIERKQVSLGDEIKPI